LVEKDIPEVPPGLVLLRNAFSTMNPSDKANLKQTEGELLGKEGTGTIIKVGSGVSEELIGKKVAFSNLAGGSWSTHSL